MLWLARYYRPNSGVKYELMIAQSRVRGRLTLDLVTPILRHLPDLTVR